MVLSYIGAGEAAAIRAAFRRLEATIQVTFWDVTFAVWRKDRPATSWDDGTATERWEQVGAGIGRLTANGLNGPQASEGMIFPESPYLLKTDVNAFDVFRAPDASESEHDVSRAWLVIEGRLFKVDAFKPRAGERRHATAAITEVFNVALPEGTP